MEGIRNLGRKIKPDGLASGNVQEKKILKLVHVVEMTDDKANKIIARKDVNLSPGTKVSTLKAQLGYKLDDDLLRGKNRQLLGNDVDLYASVEYGEKLIIIPDTLVGA
ncbi:MAG: hypothetical protein AB1779_02210 [Candidatus Thermoplasmatota archaeon]